jgi:hypothetical protein
VLRALVPWVAVVGPLLVLLVVLPGGSRLSEVLTWAVALGLGAFLVYATGSPAVVLVWAVGVWWLGGLIKLWSDR